jgi:CRISPR-associated protein Cas1
MLTLPDLKVKQILFVQTEHGVKNKLYFKNENIVFEKEGKIVNQASCHRVLAVFVIGDFVFTSGLVKECKKRAVALFFLGNNFGLYGSLNPKADGNYLLRMAQYKLGQSLELELSKNIVQNKIQNQIFLLKQLDVSVTGLDSATASSIIECKNSEQLLGVEGSFSKIFFSEYFKELKWVRRMPRVKPDIPNYLLDIGYTLLFNFIDALLLLFGFDTYKGVYHKLFFQRKSLTCDIVEPFRCVIDKQLLKSYNLNQIDTEHFFVEGRRYVLEYKYSQKYSQIFMEAIMAEKENIYLFVLQYYRHIMNSQKYKFPNFIFSKNKIQ